MTTSSRSKRRTIAILAAGLSIKCSEARSWWSINIAEIDNIRNDYDPVYKESSRLLLEDTYFLYGQGDYNMNAGTDIPFPQHPNIDVYPQQPNIDVFPQQPNIEVFPQEQWPDYNASVVYPVQEAPTSTENPDIAVPSVDTTKSAVPSVDTPSLSPSMTYQAVNGGCPPEHALHRLWLYDSYNDAQYGDGWGTTTLQIKDKSSNDVIFEGTLDAQMGAIRYATDDSMIDGHTKNHNEDQRRRLEGTSEGNAVYLCLNENVCYISEIKGGTFQEECSWELTKVSLETGGSVGLVAKGVGGGLGRCEFGSTDSCGQTCDGKFYFLLGRFYSSCCLIMD